MANQVVLYLSRSLNLSKVKDATMQEYIYKYIISRHENVLTYTVKNETEKLSQLFRDVAFHDLAVFLLNKDSEWDKKKYRKILAHFLLFLHKLGVLEPPISRISDFKYYFENGAIIKGFIPFLLRDNHYDMFRNSLLYNLRNDIFCREVYCMSLDPSRFRDKKIFEVCNSTFIQMKYFSNHTIGTLNSKLLYYRKECYKIADMLCSDLTAKTLLNLLSDTEDKTHSQIQAMQHSLLSIFKNLYLEDIIQDTNLIAFFKLYIDFDSSMTINVIKKILSSRNVCLWENCRYQYKDRVQNAFRYLDITDPHKRTLVKDFLCLHTGGYLWSVYDAFCEHFDDSLPSADCNLDFSAFLHQINYFTAHNLDTSICGIVTSFYIYIYNSVDPNIFGTDEAIIAAMHRTRIGYELSNGYTIVPYNPLEDVPLGDKWILCYKEHIHSDITQTKLLDFSDITCEIYKLWIKQFIWKENVMVETKAHPLGVYKAGMDYIYQIKTGTVRTFFAHPSTAIEKITVSEIEAYKNHILSTSENNRTRCSRIYNFRNLIKYIDENKLGEIESGVYYNLTYTLSNDYENTQAIPDDELQAVSAIMKEKAEQDISAAMYYAVFYIALETEFRGSQIVTLKRNCIRETAKDNEYVLVSGTKKSAGEEIEQPITTYVKREIDIIIRLGEEYREKCSNTRLKDCLFIVPGARRNLFTAMTTVKFNTFFKRCCSEAGIPLYSLQNLRDTHMTKADEYAIRENLSEIERSVLTGHKSSTTDIVHYVDTNIRTLLEAVHGVIIGNVNVDGQIVRNLDPAIRRPENIVSNGCGYCKSQACNNFTYLDCMLCKDFVTTIDRLPYFEEQIRVVDAQIPNCELKHDKEDLINIKLLLLHFIEKIMIIKEAEINGRD